MQTNTQNIKENAVFSLINDAPEYQPQTEEWPEPKPIQAPLPPVMPFNAEILLPEVLRTWVMDEANRKPCPPDYIAAAVMVALGSVIGARCTIKPKSKDDWFIVPNLWGGIVGPPSAKKTPAISAAMKPMDRLIALAFKAQEEGRVLFETDNLIFEAQKEEITRRLKGAAKPKNKKAKNENDAEINGIAVELQKHCAEAPTEPTLHRYKTNDATVEKLGELLRDNPNGILVARDELVGLLASWEKSGREGDRAFFLEAWNGNQSFDTDRIGRGSVFIPNLCISLFGGIQPDKLIAYLEQATNALANDGMLQRFQMLVYPDHRTWEWRDTLPDKAARESVYDVFDKLADFDPVALGAAPMDDTANFHFSDSLTKRRSFLSSGRTICIDAVSQKKITLSLNSTSPNMTSYSPRWHSFYILWTVWRQDKTALSQSKQQYGRRHGASIWNRTRVAVTAFCLMMASDPHKHLLNTLNLAI